MLGRNLQQTALHQVEKQEVVGSLRADHGNGECIVHASRVPVQADQAYVV
jgi:hypothetical protein